MKPPCWNREPFAPGRTVHVIDQQTGEPVSAWISNGWFVDRCVTHDGRSIGPDGANFPEAHGWLPWCDTCRWDPR